MEMFTICQGMRISRTGFGALPIQRVPKSESTEILRAAYDGGITFFDTARAYSDSEEKLNAAFSDVREKIIIATKTQATDAAGMECDLETSLCTLDTDYVDIYQFHNTSFVPKPGGADGLYDAALKAKRAGKIRAIGITQHSLSGAKEALASGLYATIQYPYNHLATDEEIAFANECHEKGVGLIAMKALSGGLVTDARLPFAFIRQFPGIVPIWGIQRMAEIEQILAMSDNPPELAGEIQQKIDEDRRELSGSFCRACGYCLPCPVGIPIQNANRIKQLMTRSPVAPFITQAWQAEMEKIPKCTKCKVCESRCPYHLKPYETLPEQLAYYRSVIEKL